VTVDDEIEERILDKAEYIEEAVSVLSQKRSLDENTYHEDREQRAIVEREFETATGACIDIAELPIKNADRPMPDTNGRKFVALADMGILSKETSKKMKKAAGFRNILAHRYGPDIDDSSVYHNLQTELGWFPTFLREIRQFLACR
jgi:uncharacterized protein YutE (UPF0331/DUF86 family)